MQTSTDDLRTDLDDVLDKVEIGRECVILRHGKAVAKIVPYREEPHVNRTQPDCARGTVKVLGDLTEPLICESDWEMLR